MQTAALGGNLHAGMHDMVKEYESKFGIDKPLVTQYLNYLADMIRFDFGYSIANYPARVCDMIAQGLPWTITLMTVTTLLASRSATCSARCRPGRGAPRWLTSSCRRCWRWARCRSSCSA